MALYDRRFGLPQSVVNYLNQGLPSISLNVPTTPVVDETEDKPTGLTPEQLALLYPQNVSGGGGGNDPYSGGGKFSNLDLSRSKTFTKDVYDEEEGGFVPTELKAYYNPTLGNYQTFEGKNINPAFSNTGPTFGLGSLVLDMFGLSPKTVGGYVPGSIRGYYDSPMDFFKKNKNEQMATVQQLADQRKKDKTRIDALKAMTTNTAGGGKDLGRPPSPPSQGGDGPSYSGMGSIGSGGSKSSKSSSKNSSQAGGSFNSLGFSDIRLKENIELIGKSPSNINIYKFNYKNNPTTYQGAMAHEVLWASVKHSNGYMMVDYNLLDVDFKKYNA